MIFKKISQIWSTGLTRGGRSRGRNNRSQLFPVLLMLVLDTEKPSFQLSSISFFSSSSDIKSSLERLFCLLLFMYAEDKKEN